MSSLSNNRAAERVRRAGGAMPRRAKRLDPYPHPVARPTGARRSVNSLLHRPIASAGR